MTILSSLILLFTIAIILLMLYFTAYNFYKRIYIPYKREVLNLDFETSLFVLKTIINSELDAYENDIFNKKGSITNSNFENYYNDICDKIVRNLSPNLVKQLSLYITEDMIIVIIARATKKFLTEKINGTI